MSTSAKSRARSASPAGPEYAPAPVPASRRLRALAAAAAGCRACALWTLGTQTVFGAGPARARVILIGE